MFDFFLYLLLLCLIGTIRIPGQILMIPITHNRTNQIKLLGWKLSSVVFSRKLTLWNTTWLNFQSNICSISVSTVMLSNWDHWVHFQNFISRVFSVLEDLMSSFKNKFSSYLICFKRNWNSFSHTCYYDDISTEILMGKGMK